jgi:hypothetical protein
MRIKNYFLVTLLLITVGCAAPQIKVVDQMGQLMPNPHYSVISTSKVPIRATFYYVGYVEVRDADNSLQYTPVYLDRRTSKIKSKNFEKIYLVLQVHNPSRSTYSVFMHQAVKRNNIKNYILSEGVIAISKLNYRQYMLRLPLEQGVTNVSYNVMLTDEFNTETYMQTGAFLYQLK